MAFLVNVPEEVLYGGRLWSTRVSHKQDGMLDLDHLLQQPGITHRVHSGHQDLIELLVRIVDILGHQLIPWDPLQLKNWIHDKVYVRSHRLIHLYSSWSQITWRRKVLWVSRLFRKVYALNFCITLCIELWLSGYFKKQSNKIVITIFVILRKVLLVLQ